MILKLDLQSETPIYMQVKHEIMKGIALGKLTPGETLPSVRAMAGDLGINMHTVNKAYQVLKQEGYILIHRQKGVVINPEGMPKADKDFLGHLKQELQPLITESFCRGVEKEEFFSICSGMFAQFIREGE